MEHTSYIMALASLLTALGGVELVKYLLNRRFNSRTESARATADEFGALRDIITFLQEQLRKAEERHRDQTELVRALNNEILKITREKAAAEGELSLKRCERRNCSNRQPLNGF